MNIFLYIIVGAVGIWLGAYFGRGGVKGETFTSVSADKLSDMREEARKALSDRTEKRKEKILHLMNSEAVHQEELKACNVADIKKGITSENVEKLLEVSNQTARKYLNELESENKIEQIGSSGRGVYYVLK